MKEQARRPGARPADDRSARPGQRPFRPRPPGHVPPPAVAQRDVQITLQPRSAVDAPGAPAERAADQVAEQVSERIAAAERAPEAPDRQPGPVRPGASPGPRPLHTELRSALAQAPAGQPLPGQVQRQMERAFGHSFAQVRVHADPAADRLNQMLEAHAFTTGGDIFFRRGAYQPTSPAGRQLLAHELTHVLQQRGGPGGDRAPVQRKSAIAVAVTLADTTDAIADVTIAGRPEHKLFAVSGGGRAEGDHTTAWAVMRLTVTNRLRGKTLGEAVAELGALLEAAKQLPGAAKDRLDAMGERGTFAREKLDQAEVAQRAAKSALTQHGAERTHGALQSAIAAYLTYRNAIGLNVAYLGKSARSGGEARPLAVLQYWEQHWTDTNAPAVDPQKQIDQRADILNALGVMYSGKVDAAILNDEADVPGRLSGEGDSALIAALHTQYRASVAAAFPNLMQRLQPSSRTLDSNAGSTWKGTVPEAAREQQTGAPSAVQLELKGGTIVNVLVSGRPKRDAEAGLEGDHTTAYIVARRAIERALIGRSVQQAVKGLNGLRDIYSTMPGTATERIKALSPNRQALYNKATEELEAARKKAAGAATVETVQRYAMALLFFRNSMALTVVKGGNLSNNKGEQDHIQTLDVVEAALTRNQKRSATTIVNVVASLFDSAAVTRFNEATNRTRGRSGADEAPGSTSGDSFESLYAAALRQHLLAIKAAAPSTFDSLNEVMVRALVIKLAGDNRVNADAVVTALTGVLTQGRAAQATGLDRLNKAVTPGAKKRRRSSGPKHGQRKRQRRANAEDDEDWTG